MTLMIGSSEIIAVNVGDVSISKIYQGSDVVWEPNAELEILSVWPGADPITETLNEFGTGAGSELGTYFSISAPITVYGIRVWFPDDVGVIEDDRFAKLWINLGDPVALLQLPDQPSPGWQEFLFDTPYDLDDLEQVYVISHNTADYGYLSHGCDADIVNGVVTFPEEAGRFNGAAGGYPNDSFNNTYYFVDILYTIT